MFYRKGNRYLSLALFAAFFLFLQACARFHGEDKNAFEKEIRSVSNLMERKEIQELEKKIENLKKQHEESMTNLRILEERSTFLRRGAERLKSQFDSLKDRVPKPSPEMQKEAVNIIFLRKEINRMENDLKQFQERAD